MVKNLVWWDRILIVSVLLFVFTYSQSNAVENESVYDNIDSLYKVRLQNTFVMTGGAYFTEINIVAPDFEGRAVVATTHLFKEICREYKAIYDTLVIQNVKSKYLDIYNELDTFVINKNILSDTSNPRFWSTPGIMPVLPYSEIDTLQSFKQVIENYFSPLESQLNNEVTSHRLYLDSLSSLTILPNIISKLLDEKQVVIKSDFANWVTTKEYIGSEIYRYQGEDGKAEWEYRKRKKEEEKK